MKMKKIAFVLLIVALSFGEFVSCQPTRKNSAQTPATSVSTQKEVDQSYATSVSIQKEVDQTPTAPVSDFKYDLADGTYGGVKIIKYLGNSMSIRIPEKIEGVTVTEIESGYYGRGDLPVSAFYETSLVKVVVPNTLVRMSFRGCSELREVILEDGIKYIPEGTFSGCGNLKSIKLPRGLQRIGYGAFQSSGLESIDIPDSVTRIDDAAFRYCKNLKSVKLPAGLKELGGELEKCIFKAVVWSR